MRSSLVIIDNIPIEQSLHIVLHLLNSTDAWVVVGDWGMLKLGMVNLTYLNSLMSDINLNFYYFEKM